MVTVIPEVISCALPMRLVLVCVRVVLAEFNHAPLPATVIPHVLAALLALGVAMALAMAPKPVLVADKTADLADRRVATVTAAAEKHAHLAAPIAARARQVAGRAKLAAVATVSILEVTVQTAAHVEMLAPAQVSALAVDVSLAVRHV